jgi:hypothetical protein
MGPKVKEKAHTEKKRMKCPDGTRKNKNNDCVDAEGNIVISADMREKGTPPNVDKSTRKRKPSRQTAKIVAESSDQSPPEEVSSSQAEETGLDMDQIKKSGPEIPEMVEEDNCRTKRTGMNALLAKKEQIEHAEYKRTPIAEDDPLYSLYPDINDPAFNSRIASRKEFQETKYDENIYDIRKQSDIMCESKFELTPHQLFAKNFLSINTPYNSLLLYHGLGTGKTCTAIGVAEETRKYMAQMGIRDKIWIVASPNVQANFRQQLFNENKLVQIANPTNPEEFTWNLDTCVGNTLLKEIDPNSARNMPREKLITNIQTIINTWYEFMGYGQLANYIMQKTKVSEDAGFTMEERKTMELRKIRSVFNNRTIIIDEVHNITQTEDNKHKTTGALLLRVAKYAVNMRLLLLSATPMFDTYKEIIWLVNLMNANDKRSQINISDVFDAEGNIKETPDTSSSNAKSCGPTQETGRELLMRKLTGYVSYVRGENPYIFPFRVYPDVFAKSRTFSSGIPYPKTQMNDKPVSDPLRHVKVYLNDMSENSYQRLAYKYVLQSIKETARNVFGDLREINHFEILQKPVECLNIVYPNTEFEQMIGAAGIASGDFAHMESGFTSSILGENGLHNIMNISGDKGATTQPVFEYKPRVLEKHGRVFSAEILPKYSRKISNICDIIRGTEGIVLVYSQYIDGGVVPMALALEEMGFAKNGGASLFKTSQREPLDAATMRPRSQVPRDEFQPATYIMITGNRMYSPNNAAEIAQATASNNADGSKVKVILISKAGSEGLDFKNIRQIHILEPWFNMNRIEQIIGRGVRNLSHCGLPFEKRNVQIYLHATLFEGDTEEPADLYIYRIAEKKALQIGKVTRLLKTISVDCQLNVKGHTNMTAKQLMTRVENQRIEVQLATKERVVLRVGDQPFTDICDYMDTCEYTCAGTTAPSQTIVHSPTNMDPLRRTREPLHAPMSHSAVLTQSTYSVDFANANFQSIAKRIRDIFREQPAYKRDQIIEMVNVRKPYPIEHIFHTLSLFIENPHEYLVDKYNRIGYLVNRGEYYLFQPSEITDEQATIYERATPIDVVRSVLSLELPKEITRVDPIIQPMQPTAQPPPAVAPTKPALPQEKEATADANNAEPEPAKTGDLPTPELPRGEASVDTTLANMQKMYTTSTQKPPANEKPKREKDWYRNCAAVREHLMTQYSISEEQLLTYTLHHMLDEMDFTLKMSFVNHFFGKPRVAAKNDIEREIIRYLEERMVRNTEKNKWGVLIVDKMSVVLYMRSADDSSPEWILADESEYTYFKNEIAGKFVIDKTKLNRIIGYIIMFKDSEMNFKYKDITMLRNKIGARCDSAGKADTLRLLNTIAESATAYTNDTTKTMLQPHLCVVLEVLLRHFSRIGKNNRIYYLTPEECILNEITQYSAPGGGDPI